MNSNVERRRPELLVSTSTTGRASRPPRTSWPSCARRSPRSTRSPSSQVQPVSRSRSAKSPTASQSLGCIRRPTTARSPPAGAANYFTYLFGAAREGLASPQAGRRSLHDGIRRSSAWRAQIVARRFRVPLVVISQDVFPENSGTARSTSQPGGDRCSSCAHRVVASSCRSRCGHRRDDESSHRGEVASIRRVSASIPTGGMPNASHHNRVTTPGPVSTILLRSLRRHSFRKRRPRAGSRHRSFRAAALLRPSMISVSSSSVPVRATPSLSALAERLEVDAVRFLPISRARCFRSRLRAQTSTSSGFARGLAGFVVTEPDLGCLAAGRPVLAGRRGTSLRPSRSFARPNAGSPSSPASLYAWRRPFAPCTEACTTSTRWAGAHAPTEEAKADRSFAVARYRSVLEEVRDDHSQLRRSSGSASPPWLGRTCVIRWWRACSHAFGRRQCPRVAARRRRRSP